MSRRFTTALPLLLLLLLAGSTAVAGDAPTTQESVSRQEYQRLLEQQDQMRHEIEQLKSERAAQSESGRTTLPAKTTGDQPVTQEDFDDLDHRLQKVTDQVHSALPGTEHLVILGDASVGFTNREKSPSTFGAALSPLFLWEPTDRLSFEAALDIGLDTTTDGISSTSVDLTIADAQRQHR